MTKFAKQLEAIRTKSGITKSELSKSTGIARSQIIQYYRGTNPTDATIKKIAKAIGVEPEYFDDYKISKINKALIKNPSLINKVNNLLASETGAVDFKKIKDKTVYYVN